jgi:hypothetical protein
MPKPTEQEIKTCAREAAERDGYSNPTVFDMQPLHLPGEIEVMRWIVTMTLETHGKKRQGSTTVIRVQENTWYAEPKITLF